MDKRLKNAILDAQIRISSPAKPSISEKYGVQAISLRTRPIKTDKELTAIKKAMNEELKLYTRSQIWPVLSANEKTKS